MRGLFSSFFAYFLTPAGLVALGVLDSSVIFFLPLGIDVALIILAARRSELFWLYALAATAGSVIGAALTYWIGHKIGEAGLARFIKQSRLKRVQQRVSRSAAAAVAALAVIPLDSTAFEVVVAFIITLAIIGTLISAIAFYRGAHAGRGTV
jgi:membrane protein YqaA with SNARE-associated domain